MIINRDINAQLFLSDSVGALLSGGCTMSTAVPVSQLSLPQLDTIKTQLEEVRRDRKVMPAACSNILINAHPPFFFACTYVLPNRRSSF